MSGTRARAAEIIRGIYVITGASCTEDAKKAQGYKGHEELVRQVISGGARLIQLRDKALSKDRLYELAARLRRITADAGAAFIVNDDLELALSCGADGVHLGQDDLPLEEARVKAGDRLVIGISTHSLAQAVAAEDGGADYIGFGPIFKTATKNAGEAKGIIALKEVREKIKIPVAAIGGINADNAREVINAGADAIAVISAISECEDPALAARGFIGLF